MANRLQLKRGDGNPGSIFYEGEPIYDRTGEVLYVGDTGGTGSGAGSSIASNVAYETVLEMLSRADSTGSGELKLYEDTDNGTDFVTLTTPAALAASYTLTLPPNDGAAGQVVRTDGNGVLTFVNLFNLAADSGTDDVVSAAGTVTFAGTANEIETTVTDNQIQIGLTDSVSIADDLVVNDALNVTGLSTFGDDVDINSNVTVSGGINVTGVTTLGSNVDINASVDISDDLVVNDALNVTGLSTFGSAVDINASVDISNDLVVNDALNVTGLSTFGDDVDINSNVTVSGGINVTGISTFGSNVDINASVDISDDLVIQDALNVTGLSTFGSNVDINASVDISDDLVVNDALNVTGLSTFGNDVDINSNVTVSGGINVTGISTLQGEVTVNTGIVPDADEGAYLGSAALPFSAGYVREIQIGVSAAGEIDTASGNLTLDAATGEVVVDGQLTVNGDLRVVGTAVTFETESVRVEDRLIELGLINNAEPSAATTWDSGIVFNYHDGTAARKSGVIWFDNFYVGIASVISEANPGGGSGSADPTVTITTYAPIVADSLYLGGINAADLVINSDNEAVNLIFDGGTY